MLSQETKIKIETYLYPLIDMMIGAKSEVKTNCATVPKNERTELLISINNEIKKFSEENDVDIDEVRVYIKKIIELRRVLSTPPLSDLREELLDEEANIK